MKFSVLIPMNYNDGSEIPNGSEIPIGKLGDAYRAFWSRFGGCTVDAIADGYWYDEEDGRLYADKMRRVTVAVPDDKGHDLSSIREVICKVGSFLDQKCMYFEHNAFGRDEVELLVVEERAKQEECGEPEAKDGLPLYVVDVYEAGIRMAWTRLPAKHHKESLAIEVALAEGRSRQRPACVRTWPIKNAEPFIMVYWPKDASLSTFPLPASDVSSKS